MDGLLKSVKYDIKDVQFANWTHGGYRIQSCDFSGHFAKARGSGNVTFRI